jgi:hypothetical protein
MELNQLVTKDNADSGVWFPVELYGKSADFDLLILGEDSDVVQKHTRQTMKKMRNIATTETKNKKEELSDEVIDELRGVGDEAVVIRIAGIRGWKIERKGIKEKSREPEAVTLNGVEIKNDIESYRLLISKIPAVKDFVLNIARDRTNFLSEPSRN